VITTENWASALVAAGYRFAAGVPCSSLAPLQNFCQNMPEVTYVAAPNEGMAVAVAAGAAMTGQKSLVFMQNSGLGNAVNPLTSLVEPFKVPTLLVTSWRGKPGTKDEPQHTRMGLSTHALLDAVNILWFELPEDDEGALAQLREAIRTAETGRRCAAIIVPDGRFTKVMDQSSQLPTPQRGYFTDLREGGEGPTRFEVLEKLTKDVSGGTLKIATTGKTGRELFVANDGPQNLYVVGSMGLASSIGLGMSMASDNPIMILDGDGAALMHLGAMPMIAAYAPRSFIHLLLDNGCYDSTGAQRSLSGSVPFAEMAARCGYSASFCVDSINGLSEALAANPGEGPVFVHARIRPGSLANLPRPDKTPVEVLQRLQLHFGFNALAEPKLMSTNA